MSTDDGRSPLFRSASSLSWAIEPDAEQIRFFASESSYPVMSDFFWASTCWPVSK